MRIFILLLILFVIVSCTSQSTITINNIEISVDIANTPEERELGLMHVTELEERAGMLFVFEKEEPVTFWMKDTFIPLDIIYISSNGEITQIESADPCISDPCALFPSYEPIKYVLEVDKGFSSSNNVVVGDFVAGLPL